MAYTREVRVFEETDGAEVGGSDPSKGSSQKVSQQTSAAEPSPFHGTHGWTYKRRSSRAERAPKARSHRSWSEQMSQ